MIDFIRIKSKNFVTIANEFLKDKQLSNKAKGVLAMILAFPDDWDFSVKGMVTVIKDGEASLRASINELKDCGYCVMDPIRINGKIARWKYYFSGEKITEKLLCDFLKVENLKVENRTQYNNIIKNKKLNNKEVEDKPSTKKVRFQKPTVEQIDEYIREKKLHFSAEQFFDFYESKGWVVGKNSPMKDWKAACRTWESMRKSDKKEDEERQEESLPDGLTKEKWTEIVLFLCSHIGRIAGDIKPKMFVEMKSMAKNDSQRMMELLYKINEMAEMHSNIDVMSTYERLIKEG